MIEMMVTSSVLILAILFLRKVTQGRISMRFRYALWLAAALRLMLPVSIGSSVLSVMNLVPQRLWGISAQSRAPEQGTERYLMEETDAAGHTAQAGSEDGNPIGTMKTEPGVLGLEAGGDSPVFNPDSSHPDAGNRQSGGDSLGIPEGLSLIWILGMMSVGGYMGISQIRFVRILHRRRFIVDQEMIPREFAAKLQKRQIKVYQLKGLASPCLAGRNIYVDTGLTQDKEKFCHILAHEYCHALQHDTLWAFWRSTLVALYWFHPLVWVAAFAAKQDSELACDEAVVRLLGEEERFAYGRTLVYLLSCGSRQIGCAGTVLTMEGRKRGVKERVMMLTRPSGRGKWLAAAVAVIMLLVCGCAFTGSVPDSNVIQNQTDGQTAKVEGVQETVLGQVDRQQVVEESNEEFERIQKDYQAYEEALHGQVQALRDAEQEAAFFQTLNYQGVMAGRDDRELALDRKINYQAYYEYLHGNQTNGQEEKADNPLENGWYLICRNEEAQISLYGLYTEVFGFRGIKILIGEDVNTYDMVWCPSSMNEEKDNIRVLELSEDNLPRRFVCKLLAENTSEREIWSLYSGFRYDTGTVQMEELTVQAYRDWVEKNLTFTVNESQDAVLITYDGDMALSPLDISAYQDQKVEKVMLSPDVAGFELDSSFYDGNVYEGYEGVVMRLAVGLKLEGRQEVWFDGLRPLTVQVLCQPQQEPAFVLQQPGIDEQGMLHSPSQQRKLEEIRSGKEEDGVF